jgi:hypothetical protein
MGMREGSDVRAALTDVRDRPCGRVYVLEVSFGSAVFVTERRYSELASLDELLRRLRPALLDALPAFPPKTKWRVRLGLKQEAADFLEKRRCQLAAWVLAVAEQAPDVAVKELLWRGANWSEVPRAVDSPCWGRTCLARKPDLLSDRLSERTTQAGSFTSTTQCGD